MSGTQPGKRDRVQTLRGPLGGIGLIGWPLGWVVLAWIGFYQGAAMGAGGLFRSSNSYVTEVAAGDWLAGLSAPTLEDGTTTGTDPHLDKVGDEPVDRAVSPPWFQELMIVLNHPLMAVILLLVGFTAAFIEAHTPGLGVPGFVALVSFGLFFWSTFLGGTSGWLEILLFVLGCVSLFLEIAIIPGFGIFGIGGWFLILLALVLARWEGRWPPGEDFLRAGAQATLVVAIGLAGALLCAAGLLAVLGKKGLILPADNFAESPTPVPTSPVQPGEVGIALTLLRPAGQARFPSGVVDVVSTGAAIEAGSQVRVVEVRGSIVKVEEFSAGPKASG
jgi:membrane-bound serine protease (ClpP class)